MLVTTNDMNHLVGEIWSALFGRAIEPRHATPFEGRVITATVHLQGDVDTSVMVRCDAGLASEMASEMFQIDCDDLVSEDLQDTVGEIANIVAGNVKTLFGGECMLSIPVVSDGPDPYTEAPGVQVVQDDHFVCGGLHVAVTSTRRDT